MLFIAGDDLDFLILESLFNSLVRFDDLSPFLVKSTVMTVVISYYRD